MQQTPSRHTIANMDAGANTTLAWYIVQPNHHLEDAQKLWATNKQVCPVVTLFHPVSNLIFPLLEIASFTSNSFLGEFSIIYSPSFSITVSVCVCLSMPSSPLSFVWSR